jgi:hypothetical protein
LDKKAESNQCSREEVEREKIKGENGTNLEDRGNKG